MVLIDNEIFKGLLFDRANSFEPAKNYPEEFWEEIIQYLEDVGFLTPRYNDPKYIIDNIAINGEIKTLEELLEDYETEEKVEKVSEKEGWLKVGEYYVLNLGL